ncbi:ABC transporter ATP-binding protein [Clostridium sp. AF34-13]|uniref:ABC transporter ATP-binding protein n=1 Tax=Clostridium sp. AF34-13 TaxID=2293012 RepID=UPI000E4A12A4|nr:ABC transporter ATP-binding protein [Clostridium sp. AF34-13]RHP26095.1 ABC transporter ATP-binding protein [Clostridium sp. AF34-13]UYJ41388.1 MAG: ABC transporter ATP-binding protein/permease [Lachnospiraceae bacterium]
MKELLKYIKDYKKECVLGPLFKLLEACFDLTVPIVMAKIIDEGIAKSDSHFILVYGGVLILLAAVGLLSSITAQYFAAKAAVGFATNLRHGLFKHIESLSFTEMDTVGISTLITRMTSDINQMQSGVNMALRLFLRSPFIVFGAEVMAFTVDVKAAIVFAVVIPILAVVVLGIMAVSMPLYRKVQAGLDGILGRTRQNLTGVRVIRAFDKEEAEKEDFNNENQILTNLQLLVGKISALTNPVTYIFLNVALVVLLYVGAIRVDGGFLTQGKVIALVNYMSQILVELIKLANTIVLSTKAVACGNRIQSVFEMKPSIMDDFVSDDEEFGSMKKSDNAESSKLTDEENVLGSEKELINKSADSISKGAEVVFENVDLTYKGAGDKSLENISFTAPAGSTIGIIGGTGSGKSSLVNLIPRFYDATAGKVLIDGKNVKDYKVSEVRSIVGIVMQKAVLFKGSIRENMKWGNDKATDDEINFALENAQAAEIVAGKEGGLDYMIEQSGRNLSGGQKQRFTIARALVRRPKVLILDDSASALDFATDAKLRKSLKQLGYEPTTFIVSQRTSSIKHADMILVLDDGKVVGKGTHDELLENCEVYHEIYMSQFKDKKADEEVSA